MLSTTAAYSCCLVCQWGLRRNSSFCFHVAVVFTVYAFLRCSGIAWSFGYAGESTGGVYFVSHAAGCTGNGCLLHGTLSTSNFFTSFSSAGAKKLHHVLTNPFVDLCTIKSEQAITQSDFEYELCRSLFSCQSRLDCSRA